MLISWKSWRNKPRKKRSIIWTISKDELADLVKSSTSFFQLGKSLGLGAGSSTNISLKQRLKQDGIDFSHIRLGLASNKGRKFPREPIPLDEIFKENSPYTHAKRQVLKRSLVPYCCAMCGNTGEWRGEKMTLVFDHINGINNDNRLSNLRFLCPNCNSQTPTFSGRNKKKDLCVPERKVVERSPSQGESLVSASLTRNAN